MLSINDFVDKAIRVKYFNRWIVLFADLFFSICSTYVSIRFTGYVLGFDFPSITVLQVLFLSAICSLGSFLFCQAYKGVIRHSTFMETGRIASAALLKTGILFPGVLLFTDIQSLRILYLGGTVDFFFTTILLVSIRMVLIKTYNYLLNNRQNQENLLIVGTNRVTASLLHSSLHNKEQSYRIVGCLAIGRKSTLRISGYKVYSILDQNSFNHLISHYQIKAILFPDYASVKGESERLVRYCEKKKVRMLILPSIDELKGGSINMWNLPEVRIEDLLGRDEICINLTEIEEVLKDKVVLVTGAAGSIGSELCRQLCSFGLKQLVLFDSAETPMHNIRLELEDKYPNVKFIPIMGDVRMIARVESVFSRFHPQIVFHAAAYKHVPLMEENPCEAVHTNVYGTRNVADMAVKYDVDKFVMISTDKAVNPTNVMGASKRLAEIYVQSLSIAINKGEHSGKTRFITTRFGNVLGSNGSVIPRFREQLSKGGPLTVTHPDIIRYFMTIPEACCLVLEAAVMGEGNEIFVFDMGTPVKIADLANRMIELAGLIPGKDVQLKYTGLRPGEKLYEELLATKENTLPTKNEKIYRAQVREYNFEQINTLVSSLSDMAATVNKTETVKMMKQIIPEFKSKNSVYEGLDK